MAKLDEVTCMHSCTALLAAAACETFAKHLAYNPESAMDSKGDAGSMGIGSQASKAAATSNEAWQPVAESCQQPDRGTPSFWRDLGPPSVGCPIFFHLGLGACAALARSLRVLARASSIQKWFS